MEKWKTLSSEYLFRRPWLTVRKDRLQLPDGRVHDEYYVLEYPTWVNVIAITRDGRFVMVRQYRHGLDDIFTELVAGVAEEGEEPLQAGLSNHHTYCFIARDVEPVGERHLDATEDIEVCLLSRDEVYGMLLEDRVKQALMAAPLWKYFALER